MRERPRRRDAVDVAVPRRYQSTQAKDKKDKKDKGDKKDKKSKKDKDGDDDKKKKEKKDKKDKKKKKASEEGNGAAAVEKAEESEEDEEENPEEAGPLGSAIRGIREFVAGGKPVGETVSELRAVQTFCALPRNERGFILCAAAFEDGSTLLKQLPERAPLLKAFAKDAQPYSLIYGLEKFCLIQKPPLTAKFALVLKALYDDDVVEEEDILKWHDAGVDGVDPDVHKPPAVDAQASAAFLAASEPFVTWLREAESDTEEEE